jgi:2-iminobutanoate/2-iminopropanoate deaminase
MIIPINTEQAPNPAGHYSQAVIANGFVFVSGQLPIIPGVNRVIPEGITAQTEQVFTNLKMILIAANSDLNSLVSIQIFVPDITLWEQVNRVYGQIFGEHKPARTIIPCGSLSYGALVEVSAVAVCS